MENLAQKWYIRWERSKKKIEKYRTIILAQRERIRELEANQSCAETNRKSLYTCEPSFHKNSENDPKV